MLVPDFDIIITKTFPAYPVLLSYQDVGAFGRVAHGIYSHLVARQIRSKEGVYRVIPNPMTPTP